MVVWGGVPPHNHKTARARKMHADDDTSETYYTHTHTPHGSHRPWFRGIRGFRIK